jgi:hypothetical protein
MGLFVEKRIDGNRTITDYKTERIVFAVVFFLVLVAIAIAAEAFGWVDDPTRIYDFAGLVLAVIIGFIGGESAS